MWWTEKASFIRKLLIRSISWMAWSSCRDYRHWLDTNSIQSSVAPINVAEAIWRSAGNIPGYGQTDIFFQEALSGSWKMMREAGFGGTEPLHLTNPFCFIRSIQDDAVVADHGVNWTKLGKALVWAVTGKKKAATIRSTNKSKLFAISHVGWIEKGNQSDKTGYQTKLLLCLVSDWHQGQQQLWLRIFSGCAGAAGIACMHLWVPGAKPSSRIHWLGADGAWCVGHDVVVFVLCSLIFMHARGDANEMCARYQNSPLNRHFQLYDLLAMYHVFEPRGRIFYPKIFSQCNFGRFFRSLYLLKNVKYLNSTWHCKYELVDLYYLGRFLVITVLYTYLQLPYCLYLVPPVFCTNWTVRTVRRT
jgi:hypothetical protein